MLAPKFNMTTTTTSIAGNGEAKLWQHSQLPVISKINFWKMQNAVMRSRSKPKLKKKKKMVPRDFLKIMNKFHRRSKSSVLAIINGSVVISSSSDKAKPFVMNFTSNSTLDDNDHPLPDFPPLSFCFLYLSL